MGHLREFLSCRRLVISTGAAVLCLGTLLASFAVADPAGPVVRVEEDWSLEIIEPSYDETSPQITNTIAPATNLNCRFGLFELNHGTQPDYRDGGLELQVWDRDTRMNYRRHSNTNRLSHPNEVVTYTIAMSIETDPDNTRRLQFAVKNGNSQTWGAFGDQDSLRCSVATSKQDLTGYSPTFSVDNSKVGYASFRVRKYALVAVRYYDANGLIATDTTERIAHQYSNDVSIGE